MLDAIARPPAAEAAPSEALNEALALERAGEVAEARQAMQALRAQVPFWDEVPLRLAESFRRERDFAAAQPEYEAALALNPRRPEALIGLGTVLLSRGDAMGAQSLFLRCCGVAPDRVEAWDALGATLLLSGDAGAAESAFAEAQRLDPENIDVAIRRVDAAIAAGAEEGERARIEISAEHDPANPALLTAQAILTERAGDRSIALELLDAATALAPEHPKPQALLAQMLIRANRMPEALRALEQAIALAPDDIALRNNRAAALVRQQRHREARDELEALITEHGDQPGLLCNLANALVSLGCQDEGVAVSRRAITREPTQALSWRTLSNALPYCDGIGGAELLATNRRASELLARRALPPLANTPEPGRRLRIGLLSPTLKTHPVGWFTIAGFEALDPTHFEIHCFGAMFPDDVIHRRFRAIATGWHVLDRSAPNEIAERIRDLGIDIMIDLGGYGDQGMLPLCAHRLAPVQVKWVGSQNHSTGLAEMDWFITDRWETPDHLARFYSERLMILPDGYVVYSPPTYAPDVVELPALRNGHVTFGCFNNLAKINRGTIAGWSSALAAVPGSRMVIKCHQMADADTRARLRGDFAAHGIEADRIELRAGSPHRDLLAQYGDIDIVLDPFPYAGGLTTCEALWMGVPVLTLPGETFASRHSASHLSNVGLSDWLATGLDDYRAIAQRWADDVPALAELRRGLRPRMKASPLCDAPRFGRNLGAALRDAWHRWCADLD